MRSWSSWGRRLSGRAWLLTTAMIAGSGCIIPDSGIDVQADRTNPGAVRIAQVVGLTPEANFECSVADPLRTSCPTPPETLIAPGLIRAAGQTFCVCPTGVDLDALRQVDVFVEDPDIDEEGNPTDAIYGALLRDMPAASEDPSTYVAYANVLSPKVPAQLYPLVDDSTPFGRPSANFKSWTLGNPSFDLCNDDSGAPLDAGIHSLRLVVTDRPWYVPVRRDSAGDVVYDSRDGELVREDVPPLEGVPDLPGGATYDVANYVFECFDPTSPEGTQCNCGEAE